MALTSQEIKEVGGGTKDILILKDIDLMLQHATTKIGAALFYRKPALQTLEPLHYEDGMLNGGPGFCCGKSIPLPTPK